MDMADKERIEELTEKVEALEAVIVHMLQIPFFNHSPCFFSLMQRIGMTPPVWDAEKKEWVQLEEGE